MGRFPVWALLAAALAALPAPASAEISGGAVKIVVLNDQSSVYSDSAGKGSVIAAELALEDVGRKVAGVPVMLMSADHQNKADIGVTLARRMIDLDGADAFFDMSNSAVSIAVQTLARQQNKVVVHVGSGNADLFGKDCSPTAALWLYDSYSLAKGLADALMDETHKTWFLLVADYAFGHAMQRDMTDFVTKAGGKVAGAARHPVSTPDFSSFLLQATGTGARILAFLNAGTDATNAIKQSAEFGLTGKGVRIAVPIFTLYNVKAIGPDLAQGTTYLSGYEWNRDDGSRAFALRFEARMGRPPTHVHAGVYSAVLHYLKAVAASGSDAGETVMAKMKELPVEDATLRGAKLRPDGRLERDMLLVEAKPPAEVKGPWDLLTVRAVVRGSDMLKPLAESDCPLLKKP